MVITGITLNLSTLLFCSFLSSFFDQICILPHVLHREACVLLRCCCFDISLKLMTSMSCKLYFHITKLLQESKLKICVYFFILLDARSMVQLSIIIHGTLNRFYVFIYKKHNAFSRFKTTLFSPQFDKTLYFSLGYAAATRHSVHFCQIVIHLVWLFNVCLAFEYVCLFFVILCTLDKLIPCPHCWRALW